MDFKIPDKLTFKRSEVVNITQLDGKVIDYWEREFGQFVPFINQDGEKFYSRNDLESILMIKQLFIVEKKDKSQIRDLMRCGNNHVAENQPPKTANKNDQGKKLRSIKSSLKEILTLLDKSDKK